jgi:hypothetical protein
MAEVEEEMVNGMYYHVDAMDVLMALDQDDN